MANVFPRSPILTVRTRLQQRGVGEPLKHGIIHKVGKKARMVDGEQKFLLQTDPASTIRLGRETGMAVKGKLLEAHHRRA